jgi:hypothetical protein
MPSLHELQSRFAAALADEADARIAVYRGTVTANYRGVLGATYRVVQQLVGAPFFNVAVDTYVRAHPSAGGDLNVYGDRFGEFLASYPHATEFAYLADVAQLEWAVDEAHRAADALGGPEEILAALAIVPAEDVAAQRFVLDPSCRFVTSPYPVLRIWQVHQASFSGEVAVEFGKGTDWLLVRREVQAVVIERLTAADFAFLRAVHDGDDLATALDIALAAEATFDLGTTLTQAISNRTLAQLRSG